MNKSLISETLLRSSFVWRPVTPPQVERFGIRADELRPSLSRYAGEIVDGAMWLEVPLDRSWKAAYRLLLQQVGTVQRFVIAEVRILKTEADQFPGEWSGNVLGRRATVPPGGIPARVMNKLRGRETQRAVNQILASLHAKYGERSAAVLAQDRLPAQAVSTRKKRGRPEARTRLFFQRFAERYTELESDRDDGRSTRQKLAREFKQNESTIRGWIYACRHRHGFLGPVLPGGRGTGDAFSVSPDTLTDTLTRGRGQKRLTQTHAKKRKR